MLGLNLIARILIETKTREVARLSRGWFHQEEIKGYDYVVDYLNRYGVLPTLTLFQNKFEIEDLPEEPYNFYRDELMKREMLGMYSDVLPKIHTAMKNKDINKASEYLQSLVHKGEGFKARINEEVIQAADIKETLMASIYRSRISSGLTGVPTGWPTLDQTTCGIQKGDLFVVLGRPKVGKTALLIKMANFAYDCGYAPLFVSMEMTNLQIARRFYALRAGISMIAMKEGTISSIAEGRLSDVAKGFTDRPLQNFHLVQGQFKKDVAEISNLIYELRPSIVFVDGAYLVKPSSQGYKSLWERSTEVATAFKTTALTANTPVVASFQFNRQVAKRQTGELGFEHIQLTDAIGQLASVGIGITELQGEGEGEIFGSDKQRKVQVIGGREGETGEFRINWDWERMDFSEIVEPHLSFQAMA